MVNNSANEAALGGGHSGCDQQGGPLSLKVNINTLKQEVLTKCQLE